MPTAVDWYNFVRDICAQHFIDNPVQIGGQGIEVEIDESKFGKRKYIQLWPMAGGTLSVWWDREGYREFV